LVFEHGRLAGVLSSLDFARALVAIAGREEESNPALRFAMNALAKGRPSDRRGPGARPA
jgi:hypothetical protein